MKNRFPRRKELIAFGGLAVTLAVIVGLTGRYDTGLAFAGVPVFVMGALMGQRRHDQVKRARESACTVTTSLGSPAA